MTSICMRKELTNKTVSPLIELVFNEPGHESVTIVMWRACIASEFVHVK